MMTDKKQTVEETLRRLIAKATRNENVVLTPNSTFKALGVDSLEVVRILVALEDALNIDIKDADLKTIANMKGFIDYLKQKVAEKNPA
jgi:acyl carrier protein